MTTTLTDLWAEHPWLATRAVSIEQVSEWRKRTWYGRLHMMPSIVSIPLLIPLGIIMDVIIQIWMWWSENAPPVYKENSGNGATSEGGEDA